VVRPILRRTLTPGRHPDLPPRSRDNDEAALPRAMDALSSSRDLWLIELNAYANKRKAAKRLGGEARSTGSPAPEPVPAASAGLRLAGDRLAQLAQSSRLPVGLAFDRKRFRTRTIDLANQIAHWPGQWNWLTTQRNALICRDQTPAPTSTRHIA
jgi:hypothetical protein